MVVVIGREFLITGLRGMLADQGLVMGADQIGKAKTAAQMAAIMIFLVSRSENVRDRAFVDLGMAVYYIAVLLTLISGAVYLWRFRDVLIKSFSTTDNP